MSVFCMQTETEEDVIENRWRKFQEQILKYAPLEQKKSVKSIVKDYHSIEEDAAGNLLRIDQLNKPMHACVWSPSYISR